MASSSRGGDSAAPGSGKVFRVRNLPIHVDRHDAIQLLANALQDVRSDEIQLGSLARDADPWSPSPTKTATLTFLKVPELIQSSPDAMRWDVRIFALERPLIFDVHFEGLTALNDVNATELEHEHDCIVISGLGSHPMGSWQPRGSDKTFMWIRDSLPPRLPSVRFILYGYDTNLVGSNSIQVIHDLAVSLIAALKAGGWTSPTAKPLLFLAHSLGGVVLKQALTLLAASGNVETHILSVIKGVIFFGVPSLGMDMSDIRDGLGEQPNTVLVDELSDQSEYLPELEKRFTGISYLRHMKLFWCYETSRTPTILSSAGQWVRTGPERIAVSRQSATGGRHQSDPSSVIQIDCNHSDMVKFKDGHHLISILANKIKAICETQLCPSASVGDSPTVGASMPPLEESDDTGSLNPKKVLFRLLQVPELDERFDQVEKHVDHTFEWAFDNALGLTEWLFRGKGLFWISGKPGSGKSTMMKFIWNDVRAKELLHRWDPQPRTRILANFFFHHRGTFAQKSFDGLLRSIILQVLRADERLFVVVKDLVEAVLPETVLVGRERKLLGFENRVSSTRLTRGVLQELLHLLLRQSILDLDIFLLFDALDEYDGPPEFIADFLQQLCRDGTFPRTTVRILFSSRPWKTFTEAFKTCCGFQIHEHTQNDIKNFYLNSISASPHANGLFKLTEEVCRRARGVFLWVKLVVAELTSHVLTLTNPIAARVELESLGESLWHTLNKLPDRLDEFYQTIIERIKPEFRWQIYVLLECLARHSAFGEARFRLGPFNLGRAQQIIAISNVKAFREAHKILAEADIKGHTTILSEDELRTMSGGLIEIRNTVLTLMHQTVRHFVEQPQFKHIILGPSGMFVRENGHSFLAKWRLASISRSQGYYVDNLAAAELQKAERTTGFSQYSYLVDAPSSIPLSIYTSLQDYDAVLLLRKSIKSSPVVLAVIFGLPLYLRDIIRKDAHALSGSDHTQDIHLLLKISVADALLTPMEAEEMLKTIMSYGYQFDKSEILHSLHAFLKNITETLRRNEGRDVPIDTLPGSLR